MSIEETFAASSALIELMDFEDINIGDFLMSPPPPAPLSPLGPSQQMWDSASETISAPSTSLTKTSCEEGVQEPKKVTVPSTSVTIIDTEKGAQESKKKVVNIIQDVTLKPTKLKRVPKRKLAGAIDDGPCVSKATKPLLIAPKRKTKTKDSNSIRSIAAPPSVIPREIDPVEKMIKELNSVSVFIADLRGQLDTDRTAVDITEASYKEAKMEVQLMEQEIATNNAPLLRRAEELTAEDARIQQEVEALQRRLNSALQRQMVVRDEMKDVGIKIDKAKEAHPQFESRRRAVETIERHRRDKTEKLRARMVMCGKIFKNMSALQD